MKSIPRRGCITLVLMILVCAGGLSGCGGAAEPVVKPPPGEVKVDLTTPENATRSVLLALQTELRACAHADLEAAEHAREQLRTISSANDIKHQLDRLPRFKSMLGEEDLVKGFVQNWAAKIAYYAEGFHFDRMQRGAENAKSVAVIVPASGREDDALIQVLCMLQDDSTWHVTRIEFVTQGVTLAGESQPQSPPAPQP